MRYSATTHVILANTSRGCWSHMSFPVVYVIRWLSA